MIIIETLPRTDRPQRSSIWIRILTSDRNRQNRSRKSGYSSLKELADRIARKGGLNTRRLIVDILQFTSGEKKAYSINQNRI
jgi:hypothetical protein